MVPKTRALGAQIRGITLATSKEFCLHKYLPPPRSRSMGCDELPCKAILGCLLYPAKSNMCSALAHVCFGPIADMAQLFDHLVGAGQQPRRNGQRERFGGPQVNDQLELGRRLHGKVGLAPLRIWWT